LFASPEEAVIHTLTVLLSLVVLGISIVAYRRRGGKRYMALSIAFLFLFASQLEQFAELYYLNAFIYLPLVQVHVSHLFELAMLISFGLALRVK
jgi:hypothetical protein